MANEVIFSPSSTDDAFYQYQGSGGAEGTGIFVVGYEQIYTNMTVRGALRFTSVNIANGASIGAAEIHLYAGIRQGSADVKAEVWGINEDNTSDFSSGGGVFSRTRTTDSNTHSYTGGQSEYFTIGVTSMVQQIVNRGGWSSGNAMGFVVEDNGTTHDSPGNYVEDSLSYSPHSFLSIRVGAEPNFKPTPVSVTAPSLPGTNDVGMKFSEPGVSVLTATDDQLYLTTKRNQIKLVTEELFTASSATTTQISHNLGYIPLVTVYGLSASPGSVWVRLPYAEYFTDHQFYYVDSSKLYLHSADSGDKFYYRIFLDRIVL